MARAPGIVQIQNYRQQTNPNGPARPKAQQQDMPDPFGGMLDGLAEGGAAIARVMEQREEDDARTYSARAIAEATNRYAERSAEIEANARDGWRNLTQDSNAAWETIDQEYIEGAPTARAREYVGQHLSLLRSEMVGRQAERERDLRRQWRLDDSEATVGIWENALLSDPSQWRRAHASITQTVGSYTDITANDRRDLTTRYQQSLAGYAVTGMIQRDPEGTLRQLQGRGAAAGDPEAIASLIGGQITSTQRTPAENTRVGGVANSMHLTGEAVDLTVPQSYQGMARADIEADVRRRLNEAGIEATEVLYEGDHIHIGWRGAEGAQQAQPDPNSPITWLSAEQRVRAVVAARAEVERRRVTASAEIDRRASTALALIEAGEQPPADAPTVDEVRASRGPEAAAAYEREMQTYAASAPMRGMTNAELARIAQRPALEEGSVDQRFQNSAERRAAQQILAARAEDPRAYDRQRGELPYASEMQEAIAGGDVARVGAMLGGRVAYANQQADRYGRELPGADNPLTRGEAATLRSMLDGLTPEERLAALNTMRQGAGMVGFRRRSFDSTRANANYNAFITQIYGDNPAALAGAALLPRDASIEVGRGRVSAGTASRRLMAGAALLNPLPVDTNANGQTERQRSTFDMPSAAALEGAFRSYVGDAYAEDPDGYRQAFEAFRAYYAGAASETGVNAAGLQFQSDGRGGGTLTGDTQAVELADEAARVAVGHLRQNAHGGRAGLPTLTYLPWGMNEDQFNNSLEAGWDAIRERFDGANLSDNPRDYDYARDEDGFYTVFYRGLAVQDDNGELVRVRPRMQSR